MRHRTDPPGGRWISAEAIAASKLFYEKFGFSCFGGDQSRNWLVMKNADTAIGLFQGLSDKNILRFNPGWDSEARQTDALESRRELDWPGQLHDR